jgi:DNA transformation protein
MRVHPQYLAYVLEQLAGLRGLSSRRMFSGYGLYSGEVFFGIVYDDTLYLKTDATNIADYQSRNMPRFMPTSKRPMGPMGYHQVPADIIEDAEELAAWARKSIIVAAASQAAKARGKKRVATRAKPAAKKPARKKTARRARR